MDRYFSTIVLFRRAQLNPQLSGLRAAGPHARIKGVVLILVEADECDGAITATVQAAFERSCGGKRRVVVDIGGIGGGHDFESNGNVIGHGHKQAELQAERKDALCKAKKYEDQNVSISEFLLHE